MVPDLFSCLHHLSINRFIMWALPARPSVKFPRASFVIAFLLRSAQWDTACCPSASSRQTVSTGLPDKQRKVNWTLHKDRGPGAHCTTLFFPCCRTTDGRIGRLVHHFGQDSNIATAFGWTAMTVCKHESKRIKSTDFWACLLEITLI